MIMLVGNKVDLENQRVVPSQTASKKANELSVMFIETSAKADYNIKQMFRRIGEALPEIDPVLRSSDSVREIILDEFCENDANTKNVCLC